MGLLGIVTAGKRTKQLHRFSFFRMPLAPIILVIIFYYSFLSVYNHLVTVFFPCFHLFSGIYCVYL